MRKYTVASCSIGTFIDAAMEDALRNNRMKRLEFSASIFGADSEKVPETISRLQSMVKDGALTVGSVHIPFGTPWDPSAGNEDDRKTSCRNIRSIVEKCIDAGLGAPHYTLHGGVEPTRDDERSHRLAQSRKSILELSDFFAGLGACVNVENLPRSCGGNSVEEIKYITDDTPDNVGICFDINHMMDQAEKLPDMIRALAPKINSFHLSDYDNVDEQHWHIPHCGMINWHKVMPAIKEIRQDLNIIFECQAVKGSAWRSNNRYDSAVRLYEYSAFYLENVEKFADLDAEFETFRIPGN